MRIKSESNKRTFILIALCLVLVMMGVGYAAFSSLLTINGTANISNSWCVGFDTTKTNTMNITKGLSTGTQPTGTMNYTGNTCEVNYKPNAQLASAFYQPGDEIEYTLTIKNKSSVTAAIKSIIINGNESVTSDWKHTDGNISYEIKMPESTTLDPNEETTMKVITKFQNETPIEGSYTKETRTLSIAINSEQDDGEGGMEIIPSTFTGSIYRWSTRGVSNGDSIVPVSGTKWCANHPEYGNSCDFGVSWDTEQECETYVETNMSGQNVICEQKTVTIGGIGEYTTDASTLNKTYYLKHDVVDDIITASYVCFVYNNAEHCMKGADEGASFAANTQAIRDFQTFNNLPDNANPGCTWGSDYSYCLGGGFDQVFADSHGIVDVIVGFHGSTAEECIVSSDGSSNCNE